MSTKSIKKIQSSMPCLQVMGANTINLKIPIQIRQLDVFTKNILVLAFCQVSLEQLINFHPQNQYLIIKISLKVQEKSHLLVKQLSYFSIIQLGQTYISTTTCSEIQQNKKMPILTLKTTSVRIPHKQISFITLTKILLPQFKIDNSKMPQIQNNQIVQIPKKPKDIKLFKQKYIFIPPQQPLLYRLNRVTNDIHVDPSLAQQNNLQRPLVHGQALIDYCLKQILSVSTNRDKKVKMYNGKILKKTFTGNFKIQIWTERNYFWFELRQINSKLSMIQQITLPESQLILCIKGVIQFEPTSSL